MKNNLKYTLFSFALLAALIVHTSCEDLTELNENPNGITLENANANLLLATVLTESATTYAELGFSVSGVMQYTQKDAWLTGHNQYVWSDQGWDGYYSILRTNNKMLQRSEETDLVFHQGVGLIMKSFLFGTITDLWGDAPYSNAIQGDEGGNANLLPAYDRQEDIYRGIIADLERANELLGGDPASYIGIDENSDVIYGGDAAQWQKVANSLLLRYYMRLSEKDPSFAQSGFEATASQSILSSNDDNASMDYLGITNNDSWQLNTDFNIARNYRNHKMAKTIVDTLKSLNDPRLAVWANPVEIPLAFTDDPSQHDQIIDGVRYLDPNQVEVDVDTSSLYVGLPPAIGAPDQYNLNPTPGQESFNPHVSYLSELYSKAADDLLQAEMITFSEVSFLLSEAALRSWAVPGDAPTHYQNGIRASLERWAIDDAEIEEYLTSPEVAFDGTLERLIEQKWIAQWLQVEPWFDYRRTGLPELESGPSARQPVVPVRYVYSEDEVNFNRDNAEQAINRLQETSFSIAGKNSPWAKMWLIEGLDVPW
ncbi:MAG: SusD/RagB family nutrient-binding outer membrane lipoprotein [Bacteroidota bacterium]